MGKKGNLVVEGAKFFCTNSVDHNSPGTASTLKVTSQTKKLGKNKYFASDKVIGTYLDDKAESFDNGQGFGKCITPDGKQLPCVGKCKITYTDYYENVEFNSSMKILLDISTGKCPGYGKPGDIKISDCGQVQKTSTIKVNEKDAFEVIAVSPQWPIADKTLKTGVQKIKVMPPYTGKAGDTFYYLDKKSNPFGFDSFLNLSGTKLSLEAEFKGDETKIVWALFKGTDIKDKVRTNIGLGKTYNIDVDKLFNNLEEGKYRIEAYGSKPGDVKCAIYIDYIKNHVEKITTPGNSLLKNVPMPFTLKYKIDGALEMKNVLNPTSLSNVQSVNWKIEQGSQVLYSSATKTDTGSVKVILAGNIATITFKNAGKYTVSATTNEQGKPFKKEITVADKIGVNNIEHGKNLLRYTDIISAKIKDYNVSFVGSNVNSVQWYLKKEGSGRVMAFDQSPVSKGPAISKKANDLLFQDAKIIGGAYFGNYVLEAYGSALGEGKTPDFKEAAGYMDCYHFEIARNSLESIVLPDVIPTGTKVKYEAKARMELAQGEKAVVSAGSSDVTDNGDGTLTFSKEGEYTIKAHLEGNDCDTKEITKTIKVATPELKKALWSYESGYKRTETGYKEDTYGFVEITGMANQQLIGKIWVKGPDDSFYNDSEKKFLLEEKPFTLSAEGKGNFKINTNDEYKTKLEKAIPPTIENPKPTYQLVFTIEIVPSKDGSITLPSDLAIKNTKIVQVADKVLYEVLDNNEFLGITAEKKIKAIVFSDESGKDIQRAQTFYGKTHKIWVHTVNMQDDELQVNVYKEVPDQAMSEKDNIVNALTSKKTYPAEKVGTDSMLKLDFTPDKAWNKPEEKNVDFYFVSVNKKEKNAEGKEVFIPLKSQVTLKTIDKSVSLVSTEDLEKVGIKAKKADGTAFTTEEMVQLRKQYLLYENGCLKVSNTTTQEAIENDISIVGVEKAEIEAPKSCYCKEFNFRWANKISCDERKKVLEVCSNLWGAQNKVEKASELMSIMHLETNKTFNPAIDNGVGFSGLIQFSDAAAKSVGTTRDELKKMTFIKQMDYVEKYLTAKKDLLSTMTDLYLLVLKPNAVGKGSDPEFKIFDESVAVPDVPFNADNLNREPFVTKYGYTSNPAFMLEEGESQKRMHDTYTKGRIMRPGFVNGSTQVKEVTKVLIDQHYNPGKGNLFMGSCKNELSGNAILDNPLFNYIKVAGSFIGTSEIAGAANNPVITDFFTQIGFSYTEATSWCAAFINYSLKMGNPEIPRKDALNALSFSYSGYDEVETPFYGSFMVRADNGTFYVQGSQGHVSIVIGKVGDSFAQLGGNQSVPGEDQGTTVNVVLRGKASNVKYFHPKGLPQIELGEPLFAPAERTRGVDTRNSDR